MKLIGNEQINSKIYWNYIYTTPARAKEYWERTYRFFTLLEFVKDGERFIDLGCGVGVPAQLIREKRKDCEIWGVDISDEVINNNKKSDPKSKWFQGYVGGLDFLPLNYFDIVFAGEVIEHLDTPSFLFSDAYKILKEGGKLIITTPIENHISSPEHIWEFTKEDIIKFYKDAGFKNVQFRDLPDLEHLVVFFAIGEK